MRIVGKILIAIAGIVFVAAAGALSNLGGYTLMEFYPSNAPHQVTEADVAKDVRVLKGENRLPKMLDDYTELVDIRADGRAVVYVHRLTFQAKPSKTDELLVAVRTNMLRLACSQKSMPKAIKRASCSATSLQI
jgi:hypothetical protein